MRYNDAGLEVDLWETRFSRSGGIYYAPRESRVPYVNRDLLNCAIFLYCSEADARRGERWGGSGFLLGVRYTESLTHLYAVTNAHVVAGRLKATVVRAVTESGAETILSGEDRWVEHPTGDDVAILYLGLVRDTAFTYIPAASCIQPQDLEPFGPGPGDECLMVGRFIRPTARQFNRPALRFGNLAMLPEPIRQQDRDFDQESFLVDMRSQSGFSGSAVVVYFGSYGPRLAPAAGPPFIRHPSGGGMGSLHLGTGYLLGIDWGNLPIPFNGRSEDGSLSFTGNMNSGMAAVVPAWKLSALIHLEEQVKERTEREEKHTSEEPEASLDAAPPSSLDRTEKLLQELLEVPKDEARE